MGERDCVRKRAENVVLFDTSKRLHGIMGVVRGYMKCGDMLFGGWKTLLLKIVAVTALLEFGVGHCNACIIP